jgi:signal transduction histidine kinase
MCVRIIRKAGGPVGRVVQRADLVRLADYLHAERGSLLRGWRQRVAADKLISADATLARAQFYDHIPRVLDALEQQLRTSTQAAQAAAASDQRKGAADHGAQRWLHGYHYTETMREWGHLQTSLTEQFETFVLAHPQLDPLAMSEARRLLNGLFVECMVESAAGHVRLQETEAASRLRDLEQMLASVRALERQRAELWREAAHDLRGNVSAVQLAATVLARENAKLRPDASRIVERTTKALAVLLDDLIELARLESGRERRKIAPMDAAALVREVCEETQPLAAERHLFLHIDIPGSLAVEGDAVKVRRIIQNLVQNALKYTAEGGVKVSVAPGIPGGLESWELQIQDTGVGIAERSASAIAKVLRATTTESADEQGAASHQPPEVIPTLESLSSKTPSSAFGEGVGLAIVKRLCELLDATLEVATAPGRGTTFRIVFPAKFAAPA